MSQTNARSLFQCQPSSSDQAGRVYTPNIPDFYFNHSNVAAISDLVSPGIYVFTFPPYESGVSCSGTVESVQACYQVEKGGKDRDSDQDVILLLLVKDNDEFIVTNQLPWRVNPDGCTSQGKKKMNICCDNFVLNESQFQITSTNFSFGVVVVDDGVRPLHFQASDMEYDVEQYQFPTMELSNIELSLADATVTSDSLILLRFVVGMLLS